MNTYDCHELNIPLADAKIIRIHEEYEYEKGMCNTCDFDDEYINRITVTTSNHDLFAKFNRQYNFSFTAGAAIRMFAVDLKAMTEEAFLQYLVKELRALGGLEILRLDETELSLQES